MASGNTLAVFRPLTNEPPSTAYATLDQRNAHIVLDFDDTTAEAAVFTDVLPQNYGGGGLTVYVHYAMSSATTGNVVWTAAIERIGDGIQDINADGFATAQSVTAAVPAVAGNVDIASIALTAGAQIDSLAVGETFRLKLTRDATNASDTATGDAELIAIEIRET